MADPIPEEVYRDAARAMMKVWGYLDTLDPEQFELAATSYATAPVIRAAVEVAYGRGRADVAAAIRTLAAARFAAGMPSPFRAGEVLTSAGLQRVLLGLVDEVQPARKAIGGGDG